jgi:hypothetical protein
MPRYNRAIGFRGKILKIVKSTRDSILIAPPIDSNNKAGSGIG